MKASGCWVARKIKSTVESYSIMSTSTKVYIYTNKTLITNKFYRQTVNVSLADKVRVNKLCEMKC